MRTKDDILKEVESCLLKRQSNGTKSVGLRFLEIEVLIDLRDILQYQLLRIGDLYSAFKEKD